MTRERFVEKAKEDHWCVSSRRRPEDRQKRIEDVVTFCENEGYIKDASELDRVIAFLTEFEDICLTKNIESTMDLVTKYLGPSWLNNKGFYCESLGEPLIEAARMFNSGNIDTEIYMSFDGRFYTRKNILNRLENEMIMVADSEDSFLDHFLGHPFDYHEPVREDTIERLRKAGWNEARKMDISVIAEVCARRGIILSDIQKDIISRYCGLTIRAWDDDDTNMIELFDNDMDISRYYPKDCSGGKEGGVVRIGTFDGSTYMYLSVRGQVLNESGEPYGISFLEAIQIMLNW